MIDGKIPGLSLRYQSEKNPSATKDCITNKSGIKKIANCYYHF